MMFGRAFKKDELAIRDYIKQSKEFFDGRPPHEKNSKKAAARREIERRRIMKEADQ